MTDSDPQHQLLARLTKVARTLPRATLEEVCRVLETLPPEAARRAAVDALPNPGARSDLAALLSEATTGTYSAATLALALRAAGAMDDHHRQRQTIELVWTGPHAPGNVLRRSDQVLLDLIDGSTSSLLLVTFAAYQVPQIKEALLAAADRGVKLSLIAESGKESEGKVSFDPVLALGERLAARFSVYVWPHDKRPHDAAGHFGALHAKCAVADRAALLVSSANITGHALTLNMELGVLIRGGAEPAAVVDHFERLVAEGTLSKVG